MVKWQWFLASKAGENGRENSLGPGAAWCQAEMSVAARNVSTVDRRGMSGGTETQTTWAVREVPAGPLPGRESSMAVNSKSSPERAGDREKALETALLQIERQFGKGSVMRLGEETRVPVEVIPTGSIALDVALGLGGLPRGRIVEIYGPESSGKTSLALHAVANAQKAGGIAAFIDAEHALDPDYAKKLGCDTDALLVSQPDTGEQALEIADMLIRSGAIDIVVIDSVAALVPKAEIEGEMGDSHVGLQARLMSQALRKITGALSQTKTTAIFINQLREKVGVLFGSPETTSGGKALKFYASVRLDVRRIETLKDGTESVGNRTRVKVVKNKCLAEGTRVFDPVTGLTHRIEEIVDGRLPVHVVSADKNGELSVREVRSWFDQGEQEVIGLRLRDNTELWVTPDHKILTERGWRLAGELSRGDRVARPRSFLGFGSDEPMPPEHARLLGYLIGDGYVGGKTPIHFINVAESLQQDVARIASTLGCEAKPAGIGDVALSHRPGRRTESSNSAAERDLRVPGANQEDSVGILRARGLGGSRKQPHLRALRIRWLCLPRADRRNPDRLHDDIGAACQQIHWLLLRWGIGSGIQRRDPRAQRGGHHQGTPDIRQAPVWEVRVSGVDNVVGIRRRNPDVGTTRSDGDRELAALDKRHRGSQRIYLSGDIVEPVLSHLEQRGLTPLLAAQMIGESAGDPRGGMKVVLGHVTHAPRPAAAAGRRARRSVPRPDPGRSALVLPDPRDPARPTRPHLRCGSVGPAQPGRGGRDSPQLRASIP